MGKSKREGRNRHLHSEDNRLSTCSPGALSEEEREDFVLQSYVEALYEKRASTRETGLKGFIQAFTNVVQAEFAESTLESLLQLFLKSMKRGGFAEVSLAAQALGLLAITIGAGDMANKVFMESASQFAHACKPGGSDPNNLALILQSFSVITFVGGNETEETKTSMDILWNQVIKINKVDNTIRAAAISCWSFLLTTLPSHVFDASFTKKHLPVLSAFLEDKHRAVRIASGEAIALVCETINSEECIISSWNNNNADLTDLDEDDQTSFESLKNGISEQMKLLASEAGGKGSSKKDLGNQKRTFRDFLMSIETGEVPISTVELQNGSVSVSDWTETVQLNFMRSFLGGGFLHHMQANPLLHEVFEFRPLSATEKRLSKSPNSGRSKTRTREINRRRAIKDGCLLIERIAGF